DVGALSFLTANGSPLPYWQPAMTDSLSTTDKREMILMARLWEDVSPRSVGIEEVVDFIYDDLYGDAYGGAGGVEIAGFRQHTAAIKERVRERILDGWCLGKIPVPRSIKDLIEKARHEGLSEGLAL
ncbi:MAG TPA: hypothetical protein VHE79_03580, partial [Spirochaetia bacterium]